jgi:hypothetical protein
MQHYAGISSTACQAPAGKTDILENELSDALTALGLWLAALQSKVRSPDPGGELADLVARSRIEHRRACEATHRLRCGYAAAPGSAARNP